MHEFSQYMVFIDLLPESLAFVSILCFVYEMRTACSHVFVVMFSCSLGKHLSKLRLESLTALLLLEKAIINELILFVSMF